MLKKMKLYKATIESFNECYIQTLVVFAESKEDAKEKIFKFRCKEHPSYQHVTYKTAIEPIEFKNSVAQVWFGSNGD